MPRGGSQPCLFLSFLMSQMKLIIICGFELLLTPHVNIKHVGNVTRLHLKHLRIQLTCIYIHIVVVCIFY